MDKGQASPREAKERERMHDNHDAPTPDHGHGHDHEHGHEHNHNYRESFAVASGEAFLEAHTHDQAATVSLAICPDEGASISFGNLADTLCDIAAEIEAAGGIVGHIKAFASQDGAFAHASVTEANRKPDLEGDVAVPFGPDADIQLVAIALLLDEQTLISICKRVVSG